MVSRHGLTELYSPPEGTKVTAHIVFVHGLFGHPEKTWSSKKARSSSSNPSKSPDRRLQDTQQIDNNGFPGSTFWPQTLLPRVIPDAKISTWGYDANVDRFLSSACQNTIHQHAQNLLSDLADLSQTVIEKSLRIIFVVHSLGGIILKEALNQSSSTVGTRRKEIAPLVFGICFLGTPHRGSKSASLGKMAYNLTMIISKRPNLRLLQGLERNSETLDRVGTAFTQTLLKHNIAIYSFREEHETRKYLIFNTIVVDPDSAKIGDGKEEVGSIPADHSNMTKFESDSDVGFRRVSAQLRRWIEEMRSHDTVIPLRDEKDCLASLDDTITRARIAEVHNAHEKTFHWLFDPAVVSFTDWLSNTDSLERPIYWIQGKPGSGKSTLMKFAMRDPKMINLLSSYGMEQWCLAAFFFHDRGSDMQKTLNGMLQELLRSILQQIPALSCYVLPFYMELVRSQKTRSPVWNFSSLKSALVSLFEQRRVKVRLFLLLDALDEHDGDNELLSSLLKTLVDKSDNARVRLKMCLASRSWTVFQEHFGSCKGFSIDDHTREDIVTYIRARLEPCGPQGLHQSDPDSITRLANLVATRASGVFIWVRLAMDLIAKGIRDGTPHRILEEKVNKMPRELKDLYADTLRRIEPDYSQEAFIMLQTALCSFEPLSLKVFMANLDVNVAHYDENSYPRGAVEYCLEQPMSSHKSRLVSRSGGLLEAVQRDQSVPESEGLVVEFIHQTVKEYVQSSSKNLGLPPISTYMLQKNGYNFLLTTCAWYSDEWVACIKRFVFDYARCAAKKCKEDSGAPDSTGSRLVAEIVKGVGRSLVADDRSLEPIGFRWFLLEQRGSFFEALLKELEGERRRPEMLLAKLAVAMNFPEYLTYHTHRRNLSPVFSNRGLLHVAVARTYLRAWVQEDSDHECLIRFLVEIVCPVDELDRSMLEYIDIHPNFHQAALLTPLAQTLITRQGSEEVRLSVAKTLLALGASPHYTIDFEYRDKSEMETLSLLEYCVRYESATFVRLLLQHGAYPDSGHTDGKYLLRFARMRHDAAIVQTLLDFGVGKINGEDAPYNPMSVQKALIVPAHVVVAPLGALVSQADADQLRQATANSTWRSATV